MQRLFTPLLRRLYIVTAIFMLSFYAHVLWQHTAWHKQQLYQKLISGGRKEQVYAALDLIDIGAQEQLVRALQSDSPEVRSLANKSLASLWLNQAGPKANRLLMQADQAMEQRKTKEALEILDGVVKRYPDFAEGWNHLAIARWKLRDYDESIEACQRVLKLNPSHFGAWNGLAMSQFKNGNVWDARAAMNKYLEINPHDPKALAFVKMCDQVLRHNKASVPKGMIQI
jgi:tetratricopeptide (TPR) repeat protein